jgi:hypothetical protein
MEHARKRICNQVHLKWNYQPTDKRLIQMVTAGSDGPWFGNKPWKKDQYTIALILAADYRLLIKTNPMSATNWCHFSVISSQQL